MCEFCSNHGEDGAADLIRNEDGMYLDTGDDCCLLSICRGDDQARDLLLLGKHFNRKEDCWIGQFRSEALSPDYTGTVKTSEELLKKLNDVGLGPYANAIADLARPCYRMERTLISDDQLPLRASKLGGLPDLPEGFVWPETSKGARIPMEFVAQINLTDLPEPRPEPLPKSGLLAFFTDWREGCVRYFPEHASLRRTAIPVRTPPQPKGLLGSLRARFARSEDSRTFRSCVLKVVPALSTPDGGSSVMEALKIPEPDLEAYFEMRSAIPADARPTDKVEHQMFGYASPVQGEMELSCDATRRSETEPQNASSERYVAAMRNWVLLLQLDTDDYPEGPGWMWGDAGMVYFWIHRDDLKAGLFEKAIKEEQCF